MQKRRLSRKRPSPRTGVYSSRIFTLDDWRQPRAALTRLATPVQGLLLVDLVCHERCVWETPSIGAPPVHSCFRHSWLTTYARAETHAVDHEDLLYSLYVQQRRTLCMSTVVRTSLRTPHSQDSLSAKPSRRRLHVSSCVRPSAATIGAWLDITASTVCKRSSRSPADCRETRASFVGVTRPYSTVCAALCHFGH